LDDETLRKIATYAGETSVEQGKQLVREGDYSYDMMAIEEGEAEVKRGGETMATLGPGEFFGEIGVMEKSLRTADVVAKTPMRLVTLSHWDLKRMGGDTIAQIQDILDERKASLGLG
jgi:CRP-like cAMP-binding protein